MHLAKNLYRNMHHKDYVTKDEIYTNIEYIYHIF